MNRIKLINNKIKDEYGRTIWGVAEGMCECGEPYASLVIVDEDDGLPAHSAWCGECDFVGNHSTSQEERAE